MTRIAVISDIHANLMALNAVLRDARRRKIDAYWMLGDAVGYGYDPQGVMERLLALPIEEGMWLAGNHDWGMVALEYPGQGLKPTPEWGDALQSLVQQHKLLQVEENEKGYIRKLSQLNYHARPRSNIFAAHGAYYVESAHMGMLERYIKTPVYIESDYIANRALWDEALTDDKPVIAISGHHHCPAFWQRQTDAEPDTACAAKYWIEHRLPLGESIQLEPGHLYHLNPGSVGFQRDMHYPCPTYLILEETPESIRVEYHAVPYNAEAARDQMREAGVIPEIYRNRLLRCRSE